ncbi:MAG: hypothetical protein AAFN30_01115 [Actinomycetota bacterium]
MRSRLAEARSVAATLLVLWLGVSLALAGFGLIASFGVFSALGVPILALGLAVITSQLD